MFELAKGTQHALAWLSIVLLTVGACFAAHAESRYFALRYKVDTLADLRMSTTAYLKANVIEAAKFDDEATPEIRRLNETALELIQQVENRDSVQALISKDCYKDASAMPVETIVDQYFRALREYSAITVFGLIELRNGAYALLDCSHPRGMARIAAFPLFNEDTGIVYCPKFGESPAGQLIQNCFIRRYKLTPPTEAEMGLKDHDSFRFPLQDAASDGMKTRDPILILPFAEKTSDEYGRVSDFVTRAFGEILRVAQIEDSSESELRSVVSRYLTEMSLKFVPQW